MSHVDKIGQRIVLAGTAGAGKSVLARQLAEVTGIPYIQLDTMFWDANWKTVSNDVFESRIRTALGNTGNSWIVDGNYRGAGNITFPQATSLIWLDYPVYIIYVRLVRRTIRQIVSRQPVHFNNRQTIRSAFWGKDAFIPWVMRTHQERRQPYLDLLSDCPYPDLNIIQLTRPHEAVQLITDLTRKS